jgi:hypothetical protein
MKRNKIIPERFLKLADEYVRKQLAIMDGDTQKGIDRLGVEGFETAIREVAKYLYNLSQDTEIR